MNIIIEKMVYGGDGLGRLPADEHGRGKAVFVPFVLEGEQVEIALAGERPGFARGNLVSLVSSSPERTEPRCPYFGRCGGCHYQHASYERQLAIKQQILRETLRRTGKVELEVELQIHPSPPWNYRSRARMKVRSGPSPGQSPGVVSDAQFGLGYFAHGSHRFLPVEECPISSPLVNRALRVMRESAQFRHCAAALAEVQFVANHDDSALLLEFYAKAASDISVFQPAFEAIQAELREICGLAVFQAAAREDEDGDRGPAVSAHAPLPRTLGSGSLSYVTDQGSFRVSAGSFFQTNRYLVNELLATVLAGRTGKRALDLYAGVGLFSTPLSKGFEHVTAVEMSPFAAADLRVNSGNSVEVVAANVEQFLMTLDSRKNQQVFDLVVVDPPRGGLGEKASRALGRLGTARITYVSCDPATFSRDLRVLLESGFHLEAAHLVDLFPQTFHMETVFHLAR